MGNKVSANALRYGFFRDWNSQWFNSKHYGHWVIENYKIKQYILKEFGAKFRIVDLKINRTSRNIFVHLYVTQMAILIANKEVNLQLIETATRRYFVRKIYAPRPRYHNKATIIIKPEQILNYNLNAQWIANHIAAELAERKSFRMVQKSIIRTVMMQSNVYGIKTNVSGRLNMANIARTEGYMRGRMPFNTLRANIFYAFAEAHTTYGIIGVKVWLYRGNNFVYRSEKKQ